ncbi:MAG TPA: ATP-binding protein, partial [Planctomycetota bacterium]|nr:ATP-binding protein [Planctomycetota bacterium]
LLATVHWFAKSFTQRTGVLVTVDAPEEIEALPPEVEINVYRIIQEALSNVVKHAKASVANIRLRVRPRRLEVSIVDDGQGFDPKRVERGHAEELGMERGMGLLTMGERAHLLGGELRVRSQEGRGTTIEASVPLRPPPAAANGGAAPAAPGLTLPHPGAAPSCSPSS